MRLTGLHRFLVPCYPVLKPSGYPTDLVQNLVQTIWYRIGTRFSFRKSLSRMALKVGDTGLEPVTSCVSSYPIAALLFDLSSFETNGLLPTDGGFIGQYRRPSEASKGGIWNQRGTKGVVNFSPRRTIRPDCIHCIWPMTLCQRGIERIRR